MNKFTTAQPNKVGFYAWRTGECGTLPVECYEEDGELHLIFVEGFYIGPCSWTHGGEWRGPLKKSPNWPRSADKLLAQPES